MDISSVNSDLIRGNVTTIILGSLWNRDRYGYDILKEIETKSEGQYKLKQPTLYNQLKRLEKQGLISSYDGDPDDTGGGRRRYYSLTAEGRSFLEKERSEYEYSRTILDKLVSARQFDFDTTPAPFNTDELRPYTKKDNSDKAKVVYREKEKVVLVEKKVYIDADGNEISEEDAQRLAAEGGSRAVSREEYDRIQAEKQAEIDRIEAEKQAEIERLEEEKRAELEKLEEEQRAELERIEEEKQAEIERLAAEKEEELARAEEQRLAEAERLAEEKRAELERLAEEAWAERERLAAAHAEEVERLTAEKHAAEEEYAAKEAEAAAKHAEEMERIRVEREIFLAEKAEEEAKREAFERAEAEKREREEREAREREEALRSQATMSLDDVFKELDAKSEYAADDNSCDRLIVEDAEWHVDSPLSEVAPAAAEEEAAEEPAETKEEEPLPDAEEEKCEEEPEEAAEEVSTASLDEIFRTLDAKSEYDAESGADKEYVIDEAEWHIASSALPETEAEKSAEAPVELNEEEELLADEARAEDEESARERDDMIAELARLEAERKAELERIARELEEMRAKLDSPTYVYTERAAQDAVYTAPVHEERTVTRESYVTEPAADAPRRAPEATLSEVFRKIEERDAAEKAEKERKETDAAADYAEATVVSPSANEEDKGEFVVSAVANRRTNAFDYEKNDVNYREFFSSIASTQTAQAEKAKETSERAIVRPEPDLKSRLYSEGFKMRSYDRRNTSEYYTFNFISANRLNRDCWLIVMAIFLVEAAIMWACTARDISYVYFLPIMAGGALLTLIPTFVWMANPTRRKRADFNVKLSVLNRGMMLIELAVVLVLIAFFGVGVSVTDTVLILETMVLPVILLTNLPLSSLIYYGLYRSKRYHTA